MGKPCVAAQITQLPTMIMSDLQAATDGHRKMSQIVKDLDAVIVLDTDWLVVNSNTAFKANRSHYGT